MCLKLKIDIFKKYDKVSYVYENFVKNFYVFYV